MEKVVLVTGSSRGIGKCIVENLAREGYNVVLNYNISEESAKKTKKDLENEGYKIEIYKADVSKAEEARKLVEFTLEKYNKIDVLINNAGIYNFNFIQNITEQEWDNIINVNLKSVFLCSREVLKQYMINAKNGCIINISSVDGIVGAACEAHYCASKAGIDGITKSLAKELGPSNIRVNSIAPGAIKTDINKDVSEQDWKVVEEETPLRKTGNPEDISNCVKWLIEDKFTTGQVISINGGWVIT